ncbi:hypothetical protein E2C01_102389 [Portunus trituberculatus]|uniref:Uncharacterized protein n=1 Tax=Portunus trituberculatus TaxID=210409 RepID=A0A5B7K832_PORTR|nr:hypothetical protein [Portunus trituberculatus]
MRQATSVSSSSRCNGSSTRAEQGVVLMAVGQQQHDPPRGFTGSWGGPVGRHRGWGGRCLPLALPATYLRLLASRSGRRRVGRSGARRSSPLSTEAKPATPRRYLRGRAASCAAEVEAVGETEVWAVEAWAAEGCVAAWGSGCRRAGEAAYVAAASEALSAAPLLCPAARPLSRTGSRPTTVCLTRARRLGSR